MRHHLTGCLAYGFLFAATLSGASDPESILSVRVYNVAGVEQHRLKCARHIASSVFHKAGLEVHWKEADPSSPEAYREDFTAAAAHPPSRSELAVRILAHVPGQFYRGALGIARPFARSGMNVTIFYDRIQDLAAQQGVCPATVLGHVIAHEIGHVILGSCGHSPAGIMRAQWTRADFARPYLLSFTPAESSRLRESIGER